MFKNELELISYNSNKDYLKRKETNEELLSPTKSIKNTHFSTESTGY